MFFSRITLPGESRHSPEMLSIFRSPYSLHQSVWKLFADHQDRKRDFLYRVDKQGIKPVIYTVSLREPEQTDFWQVESKEYAPKLQSGTGLAFMLRVNPIVSRKNASGKQCRHDVVMDMKTEFRKKELRADIPSTAYLSQQAGWNWLSCRAEQYGFTVEQEQVRADSYTRSKFTRKGGRRIQFSTLDFSGSLMVSDPVLFNQALFAGIGPAKGFGCGLMLVRRL